MTAGHRVAGGEEAPAYQWKLIYDVNVLAHVYAAKYVLPGMLERGGGYLLNTASAAGLLTEFHSAPYTVSKHAAVGFAEWLAINYGPRGIRVSVLCPAGVRTPMAERIPSLMKDAILPEALAEQVLQAIDEERFMISFCVAPLPGESQRLRTLPQPHARAARRGRSNRCPPATG